MLREWYRTPLQAWGSFLLPPLKMSTVWGAGTGIPTKSKLKMDQIRISVLFGDIRVVPKWSVVKATGGLSQLSV